MKETEILLCRDSSPALRYSRQGSNGMRWRIVLLAISLCPQVLVAQRRPRHRSRCLTYEFTLANGLNVILHRDTSVPVVSVNVSMPASAPRTNGSAAGPGTPVRASDVRRLRSRRGGRVRHAPRGGRCVQ